MGETVYIDEFERGDVLISETTLRGVEPLLAGEMEDPTNVTPIRFILLNNFLEAIILQNRLVSIDFISPTELDWLQRMIDQHVLPIRLVRWPLDEAIGIHDVEAKTGIGLLCTRLYPVLCDVFRHTSGLSPKDWTYYHVLKARQLGIPLFLNEFESLILYEISPLGGMLSISDISIRKLERAREIQARKANVEIGVKVYDVYLPAILSVILREANKPQDILQIALQMRDLKEAKLFREWSYEFDFDRTRIDHLNREVDRIQGLSDQFAKGINSEPRQFPVQLLLNPLPVQVNIPIKIPKLLSKLRKKKHNHLSFLHTMWNRFISVRSLRNEMARVFGYKEDKAGYLCWEIDVFRKQQVLMGKLEDAPEQDVFNLGERFGRCVNETNIDEYTA